MRSKTDHLTSSAASPSERPVAQSPQELPGDDLLGVRGSGRPAGTSSADSPARDSSTEESTFGRGDAGSTPAPAALEAERKEIFEWAQGDPLLLSARCVKAEEALESARRLLLHIEGAFLGYWTDIPQGTIRSILPRIREELGAYEPR